MQQIDVEPQPNMQYSQVYNQASSPSDQVNAEMMHEEKITNILGQIDPERLLLSIEYRIRRMKRDWKTGNMIPIDPKAKPVSPELVSNIISNLSSFMTNNVTMSNYTVAEINNVMSLIIGDMVEDLVANQVTYGLEHDYAERNRITLIISQSVFAVLKRALEGKESYRMWKASNISADVGGEQPQEKKGFWATALKFG